MAEKMKVAVIGAGLAGSEAAYFLAQRGVSVFLFESKTLALGPAQSVKTACELVCTNSLKSAAEASAHGMLKLEMEKFGSVVLKAAKLTCVPAGSALAVDRDKFSETVDQMLNEHELITRIEKDVENPIELFESYGINSVIVASGPLTNAGLSSWLQSEISGEDFFFYDAIAPVVDADTLDYTKLYFKDRHVDPKDSEDVADYLNIPLNKTQYDEFVKDLIEAEKVKPKNFEKEIFFESCLPIDLMAERGLDTPRFGPMRPIGLEKEDGHRPHGVVQLRRENLLGDAFNLVGFQTRLTYPEQLRVLRKLPGLEDAKFLKLGSVHRNSFLNAKKVLNWDLSCKKFPNIHFAGQMIGVEGYTESAAMGIYAAMSVYCKLAQLEFPEFPVESAMGALVNYIMTSPKPVPSNINFGLLPPVTLTREQRKDKKRKIIKKLLAANRGKDVFDQFFNKQFESVFN